MSLFARVLGWGGLLVLLASSSGAATYSTDFAGGLDAAYWRIESNQPLYLVDDTHGDVRISKPIAPSTSFQAAHVRFLREVHGDFDVAVEFHNAVIERLSGQPGNQVQLNLVFGGQTFDVVRSDEISIGDNFHVWVSPPSQLKGTGTEIAVDGTLRVTRVGTTVTGYFDDVTIFSGSFNNSPVAFLSFSLQNNGTSDATAVAFDNFTLTADSLGLSIPSGVDDGSRAPEPVRLSAYPNPFRSSTELRYELESAGTVDLAVFDVGGHRVATLASGYRPAGDYVAMWDGEDERGVRMPSGVYFASVTVGGKSISRKLVLLR